ncbi:MAG: ABC transporter permease [Firmicutes bacterium]|nr:ABC transporter permease [Bacillota bacterium]
MKTRTSIINRIKCIVFKDITSALRDNILAYTLAAPLIISLILKFIIPSVEEAKLKFIVDENLDANLIARIEMYGDVELNKGVNRIIERVEGNDHVPGIYIEDGKPVILFEGNEPSHLVETYKAAFESAIYGVDIIGFNHSSLDKTNSTLSEILAMCVVMMTIFIGGTIEGFNIVEEKDTNSIRAVSVSPVKTWEYVFARGLLAVIISIVVAITSALILSGFSINYFKLVAALFLSGALTTSICLAVGGFASNQITAIAVLKIAMPVYVGLPFLSLFAPDKLRVLFYILPNYWQFQAFKNVFNIASTNDFGFWFSSGLTLVLSSILLLVLIRVLRRRLILR